MCRARTAGGKIFTMPLLDLADLENAARRYAALADQFEIEDGSIKVR
jgi:hypothetical protein